MCIVTVVFVELLSKSALNTVGSMRLNNSVESDFFCRIPGYDFEPVKAVLE